MQEEKVTPAPITIPELPDNTFILDPATYHTWAGRLEFLDSPTSKKSRKWGYIIIAIATIQMIFFIITARNTGSIVMALIIGVILGLIGWVLLRNGQQHNDLKKSGRIIIGELGSIEARLIEQTFKKKRITSNLIIATYRFANPEGAELTGTVTLERNDLINRRLPYPGVPVLVLYKDSKRYTMC